MISYLIKSGLCLAILLAFYYLVLEREKMHRFNRFYLLGSILFSFLVPFIIIYVEASPNLAEGLNAITLPESHEILLNEEPIQESISLMQYFLIFYLFISSLLLVRFIKSFIDIILKIKYNEVVTYQNAKIVLVKDTILPHTFWNYIFINKEDFQEQKVESELFTHELAHVTQRHTIDVLIVELLQIVLWFNPFFYPLKKAIQLNHEFLADDNVIASHQDIPKYQYLLLDKAAWKNKYYLASNLNYSLTKKRLLMMKTQNSKSTILLKKLAIVPLLGGLVFLFANRVEAQTKEKTPEIIEVQTTEKGVTKTQMKEYESLLQASEKTRTYKMEEVNRLRKLHSLMSEKQKQSVKSINDLLPPPPPIKIEKKQISKEKFEALKDKTKYALWIDGKSVDNKKLNNYKYTDFASYTGSFIHENARSSVYPQEYQFTLMTGSYFDKMLKKIPPPSKPKPVKIEVVEDRLPPPPRKAKSEYKPYPISKATYEKIKNAKKYVVWIDGKKVKNKVLNKYSAADFTNHTILTPLPFANNPSPKQHYRLMTKPYFEKYKKKYEKLPPPPPKKLKEVKAKKTPKKTVLVRDLLGPKGEKETKEVIEEEEEIELVEVIEIKEVHEGVEEEEVEEIEIEEAPHVEEVEEVEIHKDRKHKEGKYKEKEKYKHKHKEHQDTERLKEDYKSLVKEGAKFYLNGKKVSAKKIKKYFFENKDKVQTIDVIKRKKSFTTVKLITK